MPLQTGHAAEPELPDLISIRLYSSPRFLFRQRLFNLVHRASESFTVSGWLWLMVGLLGISLGYCSHCSACTLSARSSRGLRCTPIRSHRPRQPCPRSSRSGRRAKLPVGQLSSLVVDKAAPNSTRTTLGVVLSGRHKLLRWSLAKLRPSVSHRQCGWQAACIVAPYFVQSHQHTLATLVCNSAV